MARTVSVVLSHWYHLFEGFQQSPQQFYSALEEAIKRRQIPNVDLSRIDYREGGIFSAKREYLRVRRREHLFDVCAAPFANGFFVSWWLGETPGFFWGLILLIPGLGLLLSALSRPQTYYKHDTALMFQESIRSAVLEVIDQMTEGKGLRLLSETERTPILTSLFKR